MKNIYVAATGQHVGKTTSTLGIIANLQAQGFKTGYCKPVGQKFLTVNNALVDKDAVLFAKVIGFEMCPEIHSPVILARGVTKEFIEDPSQFDFTPNIIKASEALEKQYDIVVYEGTGHPGVGSVVNLSNAQVAKMLGSGVILIVEGGIGNTIDRLNLSLSLFREEGVPIIGAIINKVLPDKKEEVEFYLRRRLQEMGVAVLGVLPYDKTLSFPIMETINQAIKGKVILNANRMNNRVEDILAGSLVDVHEFSSFRNILLVVSNKRIDEAVEKIKAISKLKELTRSPLSGVIVTGDGRHARWYDKADLNNPYFLEHKIPVMSTTLDTYGSVVKISRIEVKINTKTPWKSKRAIELIRQHVDMDTVLQQLSLNRV